jgi:hypothetical protein
MLSTDATAMAGLSGNNLASLIALVTDLISVIAVAYIPLKALTYIL